MTTKISPATNNCCRKSVQRGVD